MIKYIVALAFAIMTVTTSVHASPPLSDQRLEEAARLSANYLLRSIREDGSFVYRISHRSGRWVEASGYNIIRHAGTVWAMAEYAIVSGDSSIPEALDSPCRFLTTQLVRLSETPLVMPVVEPNENPSRAEAKLGAAGLALAALITARADRRGIVSLEELRAIGRFILLMQRPDGSFNSKYQLSRQRFDDWESLYYPGEAALGLIMLWKVDQDPRWINAAEKALSSLALQRETDTDIPHDHWALIATARLFAARPVDTATATLLNRHAEAICGSIIEGAERVISSTTNQEIFLTEDRRSTPTAIRIEGLMAAAEFMPESSALMAKAIDISASALLILISRQLKTGPYRGAIQRLGSKDDPRRYGEIRIDYVQHFLGAIMGYGPQRQLHLRIPNVVDAGQVW